jgi:nuclease-like protein
VVLRLRMRTLLTLGFLAIMTGAFGRLFGLRSPWFVGSELALLASMFSVSRWVLPLLDRRDRGASAEEQVGRLLDTLGGGWQVLHDTRLEHGNIDHIVLGAGGLFAIETKSHPGPVRLARVHGATLAQARSHADALERLTGERVEPLLVYSRAWVDRPLARRRGVRVLPARMLASYLKRHNSVLTPGQIERAGAQIAAAALPEPRGKHMPGRLDVWPPLSPRRR